VQPPRGDALVAELQHWIEHEESPLVRAAVTLLSRHRRWLDHDTFIRWCVKPTDDGLHRISWRSARLEFQAGNFASGSSDLALLDVAIILGENRLHPEGMKDEHWELVVDALTEVAVSDSLRPRHGAADPPTGLPAAPDAT
jgi:hypothetical protein